MKFPRISLRPQRVPHEATLTLVFTVLGLLMLLLPTGFEGRVDARAVRCKALVTEVDNSQVRHMGLIRAGDQRIALRVLDGPFEGREFAAGNPLLGQLDRDKIFAPGQTAFVVLSVDENGRVVHVAPQDHYRIGKELMLLGLFAGLVLVFAGWTGARALLSFLFSAVVIWKVLVPALLRGADPVWTSLGVVSLLSAVIIFLVAGLTRRGFAAFGGTMLGVLTSCAMALYFTSDLQINGATLPFSETLLYSGFQHLDLARIYASAVFIAASGAVMDLSMDVATSMLEVQRQRPDIGRAALLASGLRVGRAVVGTMTTTLLLAYSGGYITLLMGFMAQGVTLSNTFNFVYVAAEVLKTLIGSFGLVAVAPFTALCGALIYAPRHKKSAADAARPATPRREAEAEG